MEFVSGVEEKRVLDIRGVLEGGYEGKGIRMNGVVHTMRHMGGMAFIVLRKSWELVQCVYKAGITDFDIRELKEKSAVEVMDVVKAEERTPQSFEIRLEETRVLSRPAEPLPLAVNKWKLNTSLETKLSLRPISLRNVWERAKFKIREDIVGGFGDYLLSRDLTEIRTPKIVARGAEGDSNVLRLEYSDKRAELGQSPQSYKQTMVGAYDRAFRVMPTFRAEKHNITRHLNEYASLDFEMGYTSNFRGVMDMETGMLQHVMKPLEQDCEKELGTLDVILPEMGRIPAVQFDQAKELVSREYDRKVRDPYDLEPEEELLIERRFQEEYGSDFVFITHYPSKKRPPHATNDPADPRFILSFDLLFWGLRVTTDGQRIRDYREITAKTEKWDMDPEGTASYLMIFKYGTPPHGSLNIGLECLTTRPLDEQNVREASLFPRGMTRLEPQGQGSD